MLRSARCWLALGVLGCVPMSGKCGRESAHDSEALSTGMLQADELHDHEVVESMQKEGTQGCDGVVAWAAHPIQCAQDYVSQVVRFKIDKALQDFNLGMDLIIGSASCTWESGEVGVTTQHFTCTLNDVQHGNPTIEQTTQILQDNNQDLEEFGSGGSWHYPYLLGIGELVLTLTLEWDGLLTTKPDLKKLTINHIGVHHVTVNTQFLKIKKRTVVKEVMKNKLKALVGGEQHTSLLTNWEVLLAVENSAPPAAVSPQSCEVQDVVLEDVTIAWFSKGKEHQFHLADLLIDANHIGQSLQNKAQGELVELGAYFRELIKSVYQRSKAALYEQKSKIVDFFF